MLYTPTYVERQEACIRGAFSGVTRPVGVAALQVCVRERESESARAHHSLQQTCALISQNVSNIQS